MLSESAWSVSAIVVCSMLVYRAAFVQLPLNKACPKYSHEGLHKKEPEASFVDGKN